MKCQQIINTETLKCICIKERKESECRQQSPCEIFNDGEMVKKKNCAVLIGFQWCFDKMSVTEKNTADHYKLPEHNRAFLFGLSYELHRRSLS